MNNSSCKLQTLMIGGKTVTSTQTNQNLKSNFKFIRRKDREPMNNVRYTIIFVGDSQSLIITFSEMFIILP